MIYSIRRFSRDDRSSGSTGERIGAATKVVGLGTAAGLGAGYGIGKGVQSYLGGKSAGLNAGIADQVLSNLADNKKLKQVATSDQVAKKAALEGTQAIVGKVSGRLGRAALVAGGVGLAGAAAQSYYRGRKRERRYSIGKLLRRSSSKAVGNPGYALGTAVGAGTNYGVVIPSLGGPLTPAGMSAAATPAGLMLGTSLGATWKKVVPAKIRNRFAKKSRQIMRDPEAYTKHGLKAPKASRVGKWIESLDNTKVGRGINYGGSKVKSNVLVPIKGKLVSAKEKVMRKLSEIPTDSYSPRLATVSFSEIKEK